MRDTRWAILGPGGIAGFFARALPNSATGVLHAVGSSDPGRAAAFAAAHGADISGSYAEVLARDDVDAVYISTVHTGHAALALAALDAGKAVLCEKPVTPTLEETEHVLAAAASAGLPFVEAYKTRFGPFARALDAEIASGRIGTPLRVTVARGSLVETRTGRLFDPALAGGAILDIGGYPMSLVVSVAAAAGIPLDALRVTDASGLIGDTGVDEHAYARIEAPGFTADVGTAIDADLSSSARIEGNEGSVVIPDAYGGRLESVRTFTVQSSGLDAEHLELGTIDPFAAEADAVASALAEGRTEAPEVPWAHSRTLARLLADWRRALD